MHAALERLAAAGPELLINGYTLAQLTSRAGQTPFFAYDRSLICARVSQLRAALPASVEIHYAIKANPMPAVVQLLAGLVDGLDVASLGELQRALDSGVPAAEISFAGPAKTERELEAAIASGVLINVESIGELDRIRTLAHAQRHQAQIALRVNPDFELKSSGMKMGGGSKPFGIDAESIPAILDSLRDGALHLRGLHIFSGSQNLREEAIIEAQRLTLMLAQRLTAHWGKPFDLLNIGGGLGIPYFPNDKPLNIEELGTRLGELIKQHRAWLGDTRLIMELGRYLVGEAGYYVCRVLERKESRGQVFLMCDGGLHHHLANSGNFGQVLRKNYPVVISNKLNAADSELVSAHGPLCTPLDILVDRIELPKAEPGDWLVVLQSGAYGPTASPAGFLGHPAPIEMLV